MKNLTNLVVTLAIWMAAQGSGQSAVAVGGSAGFPSGGIDLGLDDFGDEPMLIFALPADGDTGVATATSLQLFFTTSMAPSQAVQWSSNIDGSKVVYTWGFGGQFLTVTYTGGWPGNATITYVLNPPGTPAGFKSVTGQALPTTEGGFSTAAGGGGGGVNCQPGGGSGAGTFFVAKSFSHTQTSDAAPPLTLDQSGSARFFATVSSPTNNPITDATLRLPNGTLITLSNLFGTFLFAAGFQTQSQLDAAYPGGNYTLTVKFQSGTTQSGTLNYPANASVPVPRLSNFSQLAGFVAAQAFTFRWDGFTGAGVNDFLSFGANDSRGNSFYAPDLCVPRELPVTATSIVLPASTLSANTGNSGSLTFSKTLVQNQNFTASLSAFASLSRDTRFEFAGSGSTPPPQPEFKAIERSQAGVVTLRLAIQLGAPYTVEFSLDLQTWQPVHTAVAATALETISHTPGPGARAGFYRAVINP